MSAAATEISPAATPASIHGGAPFVEDPHAAKISPDDPRLQLRRAGGRTLRTGPLVLLVGALSGTVLLAVVLAFQAPATSTHGSADPGAPSSSPAPSAPAAIRNASAAPASHGQPRREAAASESRGTTAPSATQEEERKRSAQALEAQNARILFEMPPGGGEENRPASETTRALSTTSVRPAAEPQARSADGDPNFQERKNAFLDGQGGAQAHEPLTAALEHPSSPYELLAGTIIPAVLITAINSDLPGPVVGQVRENVYDTVSGNVLLVPQGARLLANYDSIVAWGQERVLLCWNRLLLPNGDSLRLQCMPAADLKGAAGLTDEVDEHWFRIVKGAAVASLLAATTQGIAGSATSFNPTVPQLWAAGAAGDVNQVGQQLTRRNLSIQPTITVRPGFSVNVMVTRDIALPPYPDLPSAWGTVP